MWDDLVSTALIGTQRQAGEVSPISPSDKLNAMLSQLNTSDVEHNLLSAATLLAIYQRAGKAPNKLDISLTEPCDLEDLPIYNPERNKLFLSIFEERNVKAFAEYLSLLGKTACRISNDNLCQILNYGNSYPEFREGICKVIGKRGQWLAEQNPNWAYARVTNPKNVTPEEIWQIGNKLDRINLLKELRKKDSKKARELVLSTWKEESADERVAFILTFKENLTIEDENFLENALDDRAKDIRLEAQKLLSCLSESQFHARMLKRLRSIIKLKTEKKNTILEINLPQNLDEMTIRDIVEVNPPNKDIGQKAWWLRKIVLAVDPKFWSNHLNLSSKEVFSLIAKSDWEQDLLWALPGSISNHLDLEWAKALFQWYIDKNIAIGFETTSTLFSKLSPKEREDLLMLFLNKEEKFNATSLIGKLLYFHKTLWSKELLKQVLNIVVMRINNDKKFDWNLSNFLEHVALHTPTTMFSATYSLFDENRFSYTQWRIWGKAIEPFISLLKFREKMLEEFNL
ncbi:MAG: hypothetical protein FD167_3184 [bacterium]|nr:MAG: hypothetical protein FD167_3184 [bacterium]